MTQHRPFHESDDGRVRLYGHEWHGLPRNPGHVVRCLLRRHRRAQWNHLGDDYEEFCSCGARRTAPDGPWTGGDPWQLRGPVHARPRASVPEFFDWFGGDGG